MTLLRMVNDLASLSAAAVVGFTVRHGLGLHMYFLFSLKTGKKTKLFEISCFIYLLSD